MNDISKAYAHPCAWYEDSTRGSHIMLRTGDPDMIERISRWKGATRFGEVSYSGKPIAVQFRLEPSLKGKVQLLGLAL